MLPSVAFRTRWVTPSSTKLAAWRWLLLTECSPMSASHSSDSPHLLSAASNFSSTRVASFVHWPHALRRLAAPLRPHLLFQLLAQICPLVHVAHSTQRPAFGCVTLDVAPRTRPARRQYVRDGPIRVEQSELAQLGVKDKLLLEACRSLSQENAPHFEQTLILDSVARLHGPGICAICSACHEPWISISSSLARLRLPSNAFDSSAPAAAAFCVLGAA